MKKFLSKIMFAAVAVLSVVGFTSCNAEDDGYDEYITPKNNPTVKTVSVYSAFVSEDCMKLYDVSITLHSGDKTKTVALTESNGQKQAFGSSQAFTFCFDNVDGQYGIDKVEATVTPKANIEEMIKAMNPEQDLYLVSTKKYFDAEFKANGQYDLSNVANTINFTCTEAGKLLNTINTGKHFYETIADNNVRLLSM